MENREIEGLKKEIERLNDELAAVRHQICEIWKTVAYVSDQASGHLGSVKEDVADAKNQLRDIWEYLPALLNKIFPRLLAEEGHAVARLEQIAKRKKTDES